LVNLVIMKEKKGGTGKIYKGNTTKTGQVEQETRDEICSSNMLVLASLVDFRLMVSNYKWLLF